MNEEAVVDTLADSRDQLGLDEPIEQLMDKTCQASLVEQYGTGMDNSPIPLFRGMQGAKVSAGVDPGYRSFIEIIVLSRVDISSSDALQSWFRSRNTFAFLALWESLYNPGLQKEQAAVLKTEAAYHNTPLTLKKWTARTGAKGIVALQGRYGGTYAHPVIACDFEAWLSPRHRFRITQSYIPERFQ